MRFRFRGRKLRALYTDEKGCERFPTEVVDAFFTVMSYIAAPADERDFRALRSLHFEKLSGDRKGQHSLRLNKQWRLIVRLQTDSTGKYLFIEDIENHYRD